MKLVIVIFASVLFVSCAAGQRDKHTQPSYNGESAGIPSPVTEGFPEYKKELEGFIEASIMSLDYGVYTNYQKTENLDGLAAGRDVLLESQGLMMQYYLMENDKAGFYNVYGFIKSHLFEDGYLRWVYRYEQQKAADVNAVIDDLRVIRALAAGAGQFEDASLLRDAHMYAKSAVAANEHRLYNIYTPTSKDTVINLCYIDLYTLGILAESDKDYLKVYASMKEVLENGYISDNFPFYYKAYDYRQYEKGEVNVIELLISVLHLAEAGLVRENTIDFLKKLVDGNMLYSTWDTASEQPTDTYTSTAAYAIASIIFLKTGDYTYYNKCVGYMNLHRNNDPSSPVYGAFGEVSQLYSFDNLYALLAYSAGEHPEFF